MSLIECLCDNPLESIANDPCDKIDYGNQIVKLFFQKMTGNDFDGSSDNSILIEADWQLKIIADDDNRIVTISNLTAPILPPPEPTVEEGNEVTYGGTRIIDVPRTFSSTLKYLTTSEQKLLDKMNCWGHTRVWMLSNRNYLLVGDTTTGAGIPFVSVIPIGLSVEGIGTVNKSGIRLAWNNLCSPYWFETPLPFLALKQGSNLSGSTV